MLEWNDASIIDESKRQDRLVDAKVADSKRAPILSFALQAISAGGALVVFAITRDPHVFWAFAVPGAAIVGNVILNITVRKRNEAKDGD